MEAAVSAQAANSKWVGLGLGRDRVFFGKQSLLSINGVGHTRKMTMSNSMNCMRRFILESSWIWMGPRAIERRRFRFSASVSGQGDVENADAYVQTDDDYDENGDDYDENSDDDHVENSDNYDENGGASPVVYSINEYKAACIGYAVATCVGVGLVMFGIGCILGYFYLPKSTHGILSRIAFMAIVLFHAQYLIRVFVKSLEAREIEKCALLEFPWFSYCGVGFSSMRYDFNWKLAEGVRAEDLVMVENTGLLASRGDNLSVVGTPYRPMLI
ncbi:hypothetical protein OROGR_026807 [Orobanche gracilis]